MYGAKQLCLWGGAIRWMHPQEWTVLLFSLRGPVQPSPAARKLSNAEKPRFVCLQWKKTVWALWGFNSAGLLALVSVVTAHRLGQNGLYFSTITVL